MTLKTFLFWILLSAPVYSLAQEKCNCEENFNWLKETFEKNDAGFLYALEQKGRVAYQEHNASILEKIKKAGTRPVPAFFLFKIIRIRIRVASLKTH